MNLKPQNQKDQSWSFKDALRRIFPYLKPYRRKLIIGFICIAGTNFFGVLSPLVLKYAIEDLQAGVTVEKIYQYSAYIVILATLAGILRYFMRRIIISVSRWIEFDLRNEYYAHLQKLSASFYDKQQTGDLMTRATSDIEAVRMIVGPAVMYSVDTIITFTFAISLMIALSVPLTLAVLATSPIISLLIYIIAKKIHAYSLLTQNCYSQLNAMTQEHLSGIRVVRSYCQEEQEAALFKTLNRNYLDANMKLVKVQAALFPMFYSIFGVGMALILYIGGKSIIAGGMSLGDFVAFSAYVSMLAWPVIAIGWVMNLFQRGSASMSRISSILDIEPEISDKADPAEATALSGNILFEAVSFKYKDGSGWALKDISLSIPRGSSLGIVGQVGSGKTTMASLITRLYEVSSGTLTIDGNKLDEIPLEVLRRSIAIVHPDYNRLRTWHMRSWPAILRLRLLAVRNQ
ncbi:ATP-binding cassette domain-containing protein [bacterium]|nr:ATP-binding cassette domain-containing protein [bacterium]